MYSISNNSIHSEYSLGDPHAINSLKFACNNLLFLFVRQFLSGLTQASAPSVARLCVDSSVKLDLSSG
jgi:preprotein translocase subunit SecB